MLNKIKKMLFLKDFDRGVLFYVVVILGLLSLAVVCDKNENEQNEQIEQIGPNDITKHKGVNVVVYDGCEYVVTFRQLAHKGNCKQCRKWMLETMDTYFKCRSEENKQLHKEFLMLESE